MTGAISIKQIYIQKIEHGLAAIRGLKPNKTFTGPSVF